MNWLFESLPWEVDVIVVLSLLLGIIICLILLKREIAGEENERN